MADFYNEDLAYIHHEGFPSYESAVAQELLSHLSQRNITSGTIIDLGCGGGRLLQMLSGKGFDLLGVDVSPPFLKTAQSLVPHAALVHGSVYEATLPPCVAVTSVGEVLSYVPQPQPHQHQLERLFSDVYEQLQPNGLFLFDLIIKDDDAPFFTHVWRTGQDWAVMAEARETADRKFIEREIISFRKSGQGYQRSEEMHYQEILNSEIVLGMLQTVGFSVQITDGYGDLPVTPHRKAFYAHKE